ncbi:MAG: hypothetical protein P4L33_07280 [Capsulimonadaceae bacterium]|nr:hypothetical protein [Capsulimonadaceae bacterium]
MHFSWIDWTLVILILGSIIAMAISTRKFSHGVTDFLSANRCAGRYLLTLSDGIGAAGLVGAIANFEKFYKAGFAASWWGMMMGPVAMVIALAGWVNYRYRETRCLTMAEFFERRYSRNFRIYAGILCWISGVLNYAVFPGIAARFLVYFCGLPVRLHVLGLAIPTIAPVMLVLLSTTLILTLSGGMVSVMITDFLQAQFVNIAFVAIGIILCCTFHWSDIAATLRNTAPGKSLVDPFDQGGVSSFNFWFFAIFAFKAFYNRLGWQSSQGFNCAAKSPHESKMAGILAEWRGGVTYLMLSLMPICAYVLMHGGGGAHLASKVPAIQATLATILDEHTRAQVTTSVAMAHILPVGVLGLLLAAMVAGTVGNDTTYLHAWGSIFIQDIYLPLTRKHSLKPSEHIRMLRISILAVAAFAFVFSLVFPLRDYILMYFLVTGAIYLGGSGVAIIGGLYWKRGTTPAAWAGMTTGTVLATSGALLMAIWPSVPALVRIAPTFPIDGARNAFIASVAAVLVYVSVSLLTSRKAFDMEWLLHRGKYHISEPAESGIESADLPTPGERRVPAWMRRIGITEEFTTGDRVIYFFKIVWTTFWTATFIIGCTLGLAHRLTPVDWLNWWYFTVVLGLVVGVGTVVWFVAGGFYDLRDLLRHLRAKEVLLVQQARCATEDPVVGEPSSAEPEALGV